MVASWHAPAASAFYEATPEAPGNVELKRVFFESDRTLTRVVDEITVAMANAAVTGGADARPAISDALLTELDRSRDGAMREVVATIQAEQYRIMTADRDFALVVQGGPGTGKTVVGLHRAAYLAFNNEDLRRSGLLVVAPTATFLTYIIGVLPSLDVHDIHQIDLGSLYTGEASVAGADDPETARVKGSGEMAALLRRALQARTGWSDDDLELSIGALRVRVPAPEIQQLLDDVRRRHIPHSDAREFVRTTLSALAFRAYATAQAEAGRAAIASEATIRRLTTFTNALDRMWPTFTPEELLRSIYGTQAWLVEAADGVLPPDERALLFRAPQHSISDEPWTTSDLYCLDELANLLNGDVSTYGHIVVDEAQDLSPMQARALARRCPSGSFTVLGDLAQATGPWVRDSWDELIQHLTASEVRIETLSIGYRVPSDVLDLAALQLPLISPGLSAPRSVRHGRGEPVIERVNEAEEIFWALELASNDVKNALKTAVIVPDARYDEIMNVCRRDDIKIGDGRDGEFALDLTLVPATLSKGLEFDAVVLLGAADIVAASPYGRRVLYVAMTRCTQQLRLVHSGTLPAGLDHLLETGVAPEVAPEDAANPASTQPAAIPDVETSERPTLAEMIERLRDEDRALVERLVVRLVRGADGPDDEV